MDSSSAGRGGVAVLAIGCAVVATFSCFSFAAGFGAASLFEGSGVIPARTIPPPSSTPLSATVEPEMVEPVEPTPEPVPTLPMPAPASEDEEVFHLFWEVWGLAQRNFYGEIPDLQTITYAAIRGMLSTLNDDHTALIEPDVARVLAEDATGEYEGIGAHVLMDEEGSVVIVSVFVGGPAESAGLQAGDRVLAVDGSTEFGDSLYGAIRLIRGPEGTETTLLIERAGVPAPFEVVVTRARLEVPLVEMKMLSDTIGYVRLSEFSATSHDRLEDALQRLLDQQAESLVFDLRHNPGGWLDQALQIADLFISDGLIATQRSSGDAQQSFTARPGDLGEAIPMVVLINGGSASASEIVAGALQDQGRAILVGEQTLGKGTVQRPFALSDGSELRVTIAHWFTPNEQPVNEKGIAPDIKIGWPVDGVDVDEDPQLDRAVQFLIEGE